MFELLITMNFFWSPWFTTFCAVVDQMPKVSRPLDTRINREHLTNFSRKSWLIEDIYWAPARNQLQLCLSFSQLMEPPFWNSFICNRMNDPGIIYTKFLERELLKELLQWKKKKVKYEKLLHCNNLIKPTL